MSHSASAIAGRLLRTQLRLKVMAGVLAVTLAALVAFDVAAVSTVRRNLLSQTDDNLRGALTLTLPRLASFVVDHQLPQRHPYATPARLVSPGAAIPALAGAYDMVFVPVRGAQVTLQVAANTGNKAINWILSPRTAKIASRPGPHNLIGLNGAASLRVFSQRAPGGALVAGTSLDQVDETIVQVELIVIWGSIAVVLLIGFGVFVVLRRGLRPIETMAAQADRITAGDLTDRVTPHHPGTEVGRLGTALNGMLARIEAGLAEREASQQQIRRFFADASHELRTPLASLRANAELYQQGALRSPDEVDEVMDRIVLETRRMGRLVDDMLRLARLGQHPGQYREPVDLTAVVARCAERVRIADPARTWRVRIADGLSTVGDEELLRRAVDNLLMNVLVHTPAGTPAAITAYETGGQVIVEVSDDGPGVPPAQLPHIFERFYRAGPRSARPRSAIPGSAIPGSARPESARPESARPESDGLGSDCPGSGLGLAITAEITAAHGGLAYAAPASPDSERGLRITLSIPVDGRPDDSPDSHPAERELAASLA